MGKEPLDLGLCLKVLGAFLKASVGLETVISFLISSSFFSNSGSSSGPSRGAVLIAAERLGLPEKRSMGKADSSLSLQASVRLAWI